MTEGLTALSSWCPRRKFGDLKNILTNVSQSLLARDRNSRASDFPISDEGASKKDPLEWTKAAYLWAIREIKDSQLLLHNYPFLSTK